MVHDQILLVGFPANDVGEHQEKLYEQQKPASVLLETFTEHGNMRWGLPSFVVLSVSNVREPYKTKLLWGSGCMYFYCSSIVLLWLAFGVEKGHCWWSGQSKRVQRWHSWTRLCQPNNVTISNSTLKNRWSLINHIHGQPFGHLRTSILVPQIATPHFANTICVFTFRIPTLYHHVLPWIWINMCVRDLLAQCHSCLRPIPK